MARFDFRLPDIGEGVTEGEIVNWFVAVGDQIAEDAPMVEVMTDKATVTIGAPCDARVESLCFELGAVAKVGQVILSLEIREESKLRSSRPPATAVGDIQDNVSGATLFGEASDSGELQGKPLATPATRRLAKEIGVDLRRVRPSGSAGQVTDEDVRAASSGEMSQAPPRRALEERTPIRGMRRKIAERMRLAKSSAAHFTFVEECDADPLVELRDRLQPEAERRGVRLTFLPFIVKAVTEALRRHPVLNSAVDERSNEIVYKKYYDIGVATATDLGLVVPVLRGADGLCLFEMATRIDDLTRAAKAGTLSAADLRNSTFTVTSLGKRSGLLATPILNHPEVGILGVHRIKDRPVVRDGQIVVGKQMLVSLSFDHRIVDGHVGADFAYDVIDALESPAGLFDEIT